MSGPLNRDVGDKKMKRTIFSLLTLLLIFTAGCRKNDVPVTQVIVWDENFQPINTITNSTTLTLLKQIWEDRITISERPVFTHKVDVATSEGSIRWLYHPNGYAMVLSIKASTPIYQVREPEKLNEILIPQQGGPGYPPQGVGSPDP